MTEDAEVRGDTIESGLFLRSLGVGRPVGEALEALSRAVSPFAIREGEVLYEAGVAPRWIFYVARGTVELRAPAAPPWVFVKGDTIGVHDLFLDRLCERTAVAATDVEMFRVRCDDYLEILEDHHDFTRSLLSTVAVGLVTMQAGPASGSPRAPRTLLERVDALRRCPAFARAHVQSLVDLAGTLREARAPCGQSFGDGDGERRGLTIVGSGAAAVASRDGRRLLEYGAGAIVGGYASFCGPHARARARIIEDALLLHVDDADLYAVIDDHFDLARSVLAGIALEREAAKDPEVLEWSEGDTNGDRGSRYSTGFRQ